ncbi:nitrilase-related carbon-nitrogen hydrolase [Arthrobacter sp. ISL-5]|uniref:nitrilase-related carbon-nitrogen hydrolase n=1 Tax=Arthrobacter sp. ISL-5 TaxID=2819111 RepID=UPI0027E066C2|nr:nitrilase-related carbon-nitrogen hydrolase [Arthrobacter sp. ISL-5]
MEFPEFARAAALAGAELLCIPTAVPLRAAVPSGVAGQSDTHPLDTRLIPAMVVPTRALESQLFIAYANHAGPHFAGLSTVADPYGRRLAAAGDDAALIFADVAVSTLPQARLDTDYLSPFVHSAASAHPQ